MVMTEMMVVMVTMMTIVMELAMMNRGGFPIKINGFALGSQENLAEGCREVIFHIFLKSRHHQNILQILHFVSFVLKLEIRIHSISKIVIVYVLILAFNIKS